MSWLINKVVHYEPSHPDLRCSQIQLTLQVPMTKIAEFANRVDLDKVAHHEPAHLDLHCLPSSLCILSLI